MFFDTIVVCAVTGSTHAGMIGRVRRAGAGWGAIAPGHRGIEASATPEHTRDQVAGIARHTRISSTSGGRCATTRSRCWKAGRDAYGVPVASAVDATRRIGRLEGVILVPVYEGKSIAGPIDLVSSGQIPKDSTVLHAHLGGQPALNVYPSFFD